MKMATSDRGEIVHFAGFHRLSPALRDGAPVLVSGPDPSARRCGWGELFEAIEKRVLLLACDGEDPGSAGFLPRDQARGLGHPSASLRRALEHSARFVRALLARDSSPGPSA